MKISSSFLQFFAVALFGLIIDLSLATLFIKIFDIPILLASSMSFLIAAGCNYILLEKVVFEGEKKLSLRRYLKYVVSLLGIIVFRLSLIAVLQFFISNTFFILSLATGASFLLNYGLSKWAIFRNPKPQKPNSCEKV